MHWQYRPAQTIKGPLSWRAGTSDSSLHSAGPSRPAASDSEQRASREGLALAGACIPERALLSNGSPPHVCQTESERARCWFIIHLLRCFCRASSALPRCVQVQSDSSRFLTSDLPFPAPVPPHFSIQIQIPKTLGQTTRLVRTWMPLKPPSSARQPREPPNPDSLAFRTYT
jgi:hypothetical protein